MTLILSFQNEWYKAEDTPMIILARTSYSSVKAHISKLGIFESSNFVGNEKDTSPILRFQNK